MAWAIGQYARRWAPSVVAARIAGTRAADALRLAVPDVTDDELRAAGDTVRASVREMPDLLRAGFTVTVLLTLVVRSHRLFGTGEAERFGKGLALATVYDSRTRGR